MAIINTGSYSALYDAVKFEFEPSFERDSRDIKRWFKREMEWVEEQNRMRSSWVYRVKKRTKYYFEWKFRNHWHTLTWLLTTLCRRIVFIVGGAGILYMMIQLIG